MPDFIQQEEPGIKGFEKRSLERMRRFYETWKEALDKNISPLPTVRDILPPQIASTLSTQLLTGKTQHDEFALTVSMQIEHEKDLLNLLCSIGWSHHMEILSKTTRTEERLFYMGLTF